MSLQINGDDLPALREPRQNLTDHLGCAHAAMQEQPGSPGAMNLEIQVETIYGGIVSG